MQRLIRYVLGLGLALGYVASCQKESKPTLTNLEASEISPISDSAELPILKDPELTTFVSLVQTANLDTFFSGTGPFTAFIPSNAAFEKFDQKKLKELKEPQHMDELVDFINYHVILGKYLSQNLKSCTKRTVNGKTITIRAENGQIWVNDAKVTRKDLVGPNGVTYVIDTVLVP